MVAATLHSRRIDLEIAIAADLVLARRHARRHLLDFTLFTYPQYVAEPVHRLIASTLDRVVAGKLRRLMIFAPPQHGKSELVSVRLPAFWLGKHPDDPVIVTSYGAALAESKSRQVRDIIASDEFQRLFGHLSPVDEPVTLRNDSRSVARWQLAGRRGSLLAVGIGGPVTGHGARLGIIDDPFENWEQAQSATYRERVWDWYRGTFRTRIWEDGAIVLIMTRWHEDDLAGRLLREQGGEWEVLRLPALAETQEDRDYINQRLGLPAGLPDPLNRQPGEALAPRRYSVQALTSIRRDVGERVFAAEYQGAPTAAEGAMFKRSWFQVVDAAPRQAKRVRYWDKAGTAGGGAATAGVLMARDADGRFYVEHVVRGQYSALERERIIRQTAETDAALYGNVEIWLEQEPGSGGKESAENTVRMLAGFNAHKETVSGDKQTRAEPFAAQCEALNVFLVRGAWNSAYIDELTAFPNGQFADQVDASAGAFNKLVGSRKVAKVR
jgi:predicted phage terminase large subunit-like protein